MYRFKRIILTLMFSLISSLIAQASVTGTVTDASTGEALVGANVYLSGTELGSATDVNGKYAYGNGDLND